MFSYGIILRSISIVLLELFSLHPYIHILIFISQPRNYLLISGQIWPYSGWVFIIIIIINQVLLARISLTLSLSLFVRPYPPSLPVGLLNYTLCSHTAFVGKFLLVGQHWHVHVKRSIEERSLWVRSCISSSVFICMVLEMVGKWPYSSCFVGCYFQDLFNIARSILVQFQSSLFSILFCQRRCGASVL